MSVEENPSVSVLSAENGQLDSVAPIVKYFLLCRTGFRLVLLDYSNDIICIFQVLD